PGVLRGDGRDREADRRLDGARVRVREAKRCEREREAVGDGEGGDERGDLAERRGEEQERGEEGEVVPAGEDVLDPEPHEAGERGLFALRVRGPARALGRPLPARLGLAQHAVDDPALPGAQAGGGGGAARPGRAAVWPPPTRR